MAFKIKAKKGGPSIAEQIFLMFPPPRFRRETGITLNDVLVVNSEKTNMLLKTAEIIHEFTDGSQIAITADNRKWRVVKK